MHKKVDYEGIGKRIKEVRKNSGLTQEQLAEQVDLSNEYISRVETASKRVGLRAFVRICTEMSASADYLLFGKGGDDKAE